MSKFAELKLQHQIYGHHTFALYSNMHGVTETAIGNVCRDLQCALANDVPTTDHVWVDIVFKNSPAFKCSVCGFIWQAHMNKPRVTCEQILANPNKRKK